LKYRNMDERCKERNGTVVNDKKYRHRENIPSLFEFDFLLSTGEWVPIRELGFEVPPALWPAPPDCCLETTAADIVNNMTEYDDFYVFVVWMISCLLPRR